MINNSVIIGINEIEAADLMKSSRTLMKTTLLLRTNDEEMKAFDEFKEEDNEDGYVTKLDDTNFMILMRLMQMIGARFVSTAVSLASTGTASRPRCGGNSNDLAERASHHTDGLRTGLKRPQGPHEL